MLSTEFELLWASQDKRVLLTIREMENNFGEIIKATAKFYWIAGYESGFRYRGQIDANSNGDSSQPPDR